ncbi:G5 and 3D domain-containing protein [Clostridium sp. C8-1-8]|uniref:G5 and 3D domain-containing protein n=1 Tax=Clostridium sp. C8-1-8 TaxID=2698831 RepID=UPI001368EC75|nr:G5 and 3D domain-containing protein [Clostridium sp. C8-1-8]
MVEKIRSNVKKIFSNGPKAKIVLGLVVAASLVIIIFNMRKTVIVSIDGNEQTLTTFKGTVKGALHDNGIVLGPKDKIQPSLDQAVKNKIKINIKKAVDVEVGVDGKELKIQTAEGNVNEMLSAEGIKLQEFDKISPAVNTQITAGMKIEVTRVESKVVKESQQLDFSTIVNNDDNLDRSVVKTIQEGAPGEKEVTYKIIVENGKEVSRKAVAEKVVKDPQNKVVVKGTMNTLALSRGDSISYKKKMSVVATAYTGNGTTATGNIPKRNSSGTSTIAVDPRVIPLGTKVYIPGYGFAIAHDTGGAIKNNRVDLYMNSNSDANSWGVRNVDVYIIAYPGQG